MMKRWAMLVGAAVVLLAGTQLQATGLVFDRGLPDENLNNAAGALRSNVRWSFVPGNTYFSGDDFLLPTSPLGQWRIDKLTIWVSPKSPTAYLADRFTQVTLYGGLATGGVNSIASGTFIAGTNTTNNPSIGFASVDYANATELNYQRGSGEYDDLWQVDFSNLGWVVDGGVLYQFGVHGLTVDPADYWFNHASNAALGGVTADGADDLYRWFDVTNLAQLDPPVTGNHYDNLCPLDYGWDKGSDINVQIWATAVPEPLTMLGVCLGVGGIGAYIRRRRAA